MDEREIKAKILQGAEELFLKYGVRSVSMDDIARHLFLSKKTLYQHFTDKEDLVTQFSEAHLEKTMQEFEDLKHTATNAIDELSKISICIRKEMSRINPSLLFDLQKFHPKAWNVWQSFRDKFIRESVVRNLQQGIAEGYFRAEINPEIIAAMRIMLIEGAFNEQIFPSKKFKLPEVQMEIFDHFVYGLVTEKGKKLYQKFKIKTQNPSTQSIL